MHTDLLGRVVEVGDVVAWSGSSCGVSISIVTQLLPKTIKLSNNGSIYASQAVVINDQLIASGKAEMITDLTSKYKAQFDYTKPRQGSMKYVYSLILMGSPSNEVFIHVAKLKADDSHQASASYHQTVKDLVASGFVMGNAPMGYYPYQSIALRNNRNSGLKYIVDSGRIHDYSLKLKDIKALGLDGFIDQSIQYDTFLRIVAGTNTPFDGSGYDPKKLIK